MNKPQYNKDSCPSQLSVAVNCHNVSFLTKVYIYHTDTTNTIVLAAIIVAKPKHDKIPWNVSVSEQQKLCYRQENGAKCILPQTFWVGNYNV